VIDRRIFIAAVGGNILARPLVAVAQQRQGKMPRVGVLAIAPVPQLVLAWQDGLRDLGYIEGQNIVVDYRYSKGQDDALPSLASELVRLNVDVIVTAGTPAALAAKHATKTIPIVATIVADPVAMGLVATLARPGGNITGLSNVSPDLAAKQLQLLQEIKPQASRVVVLRNMANPATRIWWNELETAERALGIKLRVVDVQAPNDLVGNIFPSLLQGQPDAIFVMPDAIFLVQPMPLIDFAKKNRLPLIAGFREMVEAGALMSYTSNLADLLRRASAYVAKILKGAKPADLPVEQPTKFELVINLKTATALGLMIPQTLLQRADHVIE
jgi:putative ABC transport system substrate-binding protein